MGLAIDQLNFEQSDFLLFQKRLEENLSAMEALLAQESFGDFGQQRSIGSEVELYLIDAESRPAKLNTTIQRALNDPNITLELNQFNLEFNSSPVVLSRRPISEMGAQMQDTIARVNACAADFGCSALPIGVLPTARESDFGFHVMTDLPRYHALTRQLRNLRGGPFHVHITGSDKLDMSMEDVTLEGANTSFQLHYQVRPKEFAATYNALQLVTPLVVAACANSPIVFGKRLWHETRIPLFKQSIDARADDPIHPRPARVNFGHAWVREGALEIFAEAVRLYRPLLPISSDERAVQEVNEGRVPSLSELRLQQGSVWLWNRPVYDPAGGGHLRIEARSLPAGPTVQDMMANTILTLGLTELMRDQVDSLLTALPFEYCEHNFYRAAQFGLVAEVSWPDPRQNHLVYRSCRDILLELLPRLPEALGRIGISESEYVKPLSIVEQRIHSGQTGAAWQLRAYQALQKVSPPRHALTEMMQIYQNMSSANVPVDEWPIPKGRRW